MGKKGRIVIFEVLTHQDFVYTLAVLALKAGYEVTVFSTGKVHELVAPLIKRYHEEIEWHIYDENEGVSEYLGKLKLYLRENKSILFINTLYCAGMKLLIGFVFFRVDGPLYLVSGRTYLWYERDRVESYLRQVARLFLRKLILREFDGLIIHSRELFAYLKGRKYKKKVLLVPWYLKDISVPIPGRATSDLIRFGIVGTIDSKRRDYHGILDVFEQLWHEGYSKFQLSLIGAPVDAYGEQVVTRCEQLRQKGYPVRFYRDFLDMQVFLKEINDCDCLVAPLKTEYYQNHQSSAVETEQIRFGKIAILPAAYRIDELASSSLYYDRMADIKELILTNFQDGANIDRLSRAGLANSNKFAFENYVEKFEKFLNR